MLQKLHTAQSHDCSASALSFRKCAALMSGTGPCVVCFVRFLSAFWDHGSVIHPCSPPLRFTESQCGSDSLATTSGPRVSRCTIRCITTTRRPRTQMSKNATRNRTFSSRRENRGNGKGSRMAPWGQSRRARRTGSMNCRLPEAILPANVSRPRSTPTSSLLQRATCRGSPTPLYGAPGTTTKARSHGHLVPLSRGAAGVMARRAVYRRGRERGSRARGGLVFPTDAMGIAYIPDPCPHVGGCDCVPDTVAGL